MKTFFALVIIFLPLSPFAQVAEPTIFSLNVLGGNGSDGVGVPVIKTIDGGLIVGIGSNSEANSGNIDSFCNLSGERSIFFKYNGDASMLEWAKCFLVNGDSDFSFIFPTNDGGYVLGGQFSGTWGFYITKHDSMDHIIWSSSFSRGNGPILRDVIETSDGGFLMLGDVFYVDTNFTVHFGSSMDADMGIIKVDSNGNKIWSKVIGGTQEEYSLTMVPDLSGGVYVMGTTSSNDYDCTGNHGGDDIYLARLDYNGDILWHNDIGGSGGDNGAWAYPDSKEGIIIAGASNSLDGDRTVFPSFGCPIWSLEVDSTNHILWNNCYGGGGNNCYANSICKATDGSIWIAGVSSTPGAEVETNFGMDDAWFVHTDSAGNFLNAKVLGSQEEDRGYMVFPLSNGNVIAGGFYDAAGGSFPNIFYGEDDAFVVIFEPATTDVKQELNTSSELLIYPNPARDEINISRNGECHLVITDVLDRKIFNTIFTNTLKVPINEWQRGVYYAQLTDDCGYRVGKKLIIE